VLLPWPERRVLARVVHAVKKKSAAQMSLRRLFFYLNNGQLSDRLLSG
jgi:hypothetical protein